MLPYSAGDHRRSPPHRVAFSSSLSPSAAPFPAADPAPSGPSCDLPTAPSVYTAAAGDWGNASWIEPPVSYMSPVAPPAAATPVYKDGGPHSTPYGIYSRIQYGDFPGLQSIRSESSIFLSEKHPGTCQESPKALSNGVGPSVFNQQQNSVVSKLLDHSGAEGTGPYPPRQDLNQYPFGSSYDNYMTQLSSCSMDTQPHILSAQYVNSSEMAKRTPPVMNCTTGESSFTSSSYINPCRINLDYFDCVWNEQKDVGYQTTDKQYGKWSSSLDVTATAGDYPLNPLGKNCLDVERLENGRHMHESSETKHDTGNFISKFSSSETGFVQPREFSSELLEVNNTSVDSPCWKGTPATCPSPFAIVENKDSPHTTTGTVGYNSSYQSQKAPELNFVYPARFPEHNEVSGSENNIAKVFTLPVRFENFNDLGVPPFRVYDDFTGNATYSPNKQHTGTCYDHVEDSKNVITLNQGKSSCPASKAEILDERSGSYTGSMTEAVNNKGSNPIVSSTKFHVGNLTSGNPHGNSYSAAIVEEESTQKRGEEPSLSSPGAEGNMLNMSSDSSTRAIFLKLMHNLSVALISTCKDGSVFPDEEEEILQSVIQNLTTASSKRSKIEQKTDDGLSNSSQMKFKNINRVNNSFWMAMHEHSTSENDLEFKAAVSQLVSALPEEKIHDDTKVSEASIYKKLWIEAEASACKLKYELQLARMKQLATMKGHNNTLKVSYSSEGSKSSDTSITSNKPQNLVKESTAPLQHQGGDSGNRQSPIVSRCTVNCDDDVFARWKVLQSRTDNVTSFRGFDCEGQEQQEANKKRCEVERAAMARLIALNSRNDNLSSLNWKSMSDAKTNGADDAVMATLRILESRSNNVTFLGQENGKQQDNAGTNREDVVDDAVMARLRILKSRSDNVTSMFDVSKEHEEASDDQLNRDEVEVMSSRHIINDKQSAKLVQSFDLVSHLERSDKSGSLDFVDGSCARENNKTNVSNVASPKECDTPSEETSNKDAGQDEDGLSGNQMWAEGAGDSNFCAGGSQEVHLASAPVQEHGSSPPEWEHVLKENFFHPGK